MTATDQPAADTGARSPGPTFQDLLDADTHPVPDVLRLESPRYFGSDDIPIERYTSREWHRREVDQLWSKVWQFACREEHIPEPGDYIVYEIAEKSYLVVRQADGSIKSFPNACLHRGRQLKEYDGRCSEIRCAFHGFAWDLAGNLSDVPAAWDFPHVDQRPDEFTLPECQVGTWAGFVFINPDPECGSLEDHLGETIEQFEVWDLENRYVESHVSRIIECNWKIAQEAFCEAYHVNATHPQILSYLGGTESDLIENDLRRFQHFSRMTLYFHLAPDLRDCAVRGDEEGGALHAHILAAIHVFLDPDAERIGETIFDRIGSERGRQIIFGDDLFR